MGNQQFHARGAGERHRNIPERAQVNILAIPFHQKTFNSQTLIKPKWKFQSSITEEPTKRTSSLPDGFPLEPVPTTDVIYYHKNGICNQTLPSRQCTQLIIRMEKRGSVMRFFYSWSEEVCNTEGKTNIGASQHSFKAPHERKQNCEPIMKCPVAERTYFNILVVILASQWDFRAHFCFDIWPTTKLLLICCELPAKQYNLVWEQRIVH